MNKLILSALMLAVVLAGGGPAYAQGAAAEQYVSGDTSNAPPGPSGVVAAGTVTEISGAVVLVEEDPSSDSGDKGFFTVTDETEITRLVGGDAVVPAALGDLAVGQTVEAAYAGPVMESYPTQGDAATIAILGDGPPPVEEEIPVTGVIAPLTDDPDARHGITDEATGQFYALKSDAVDLDAYAGDGRRVTVYGVVVPDTDGGGPPLLDVGRVEPAGDGPPPVEEVSATGVLEPMACPAVVGVPCPDYAMTDEASGVFYVLRSDAVDLGAYVDQRVAVYGTVLETLAATEHPVLEVSRVEILDGTEPPPPPPGDIAIFAFELAVECEPPASATFFGRTSTESFVWVPLTDPDGDGLYAGSMTVPATRAGQGGPPDPLSLPVQIVRGTGTQGPDARGPLRPGEPIRVVEDFGTVVAKERTFEASVSFCDGGGNGPGPVVSGDANDDEGGRPNGGLLGGINILPFTGGAWAVAGLAGLALVAGGLLVRRIFR